MVARDKKIEASFEKWWTEEAEDKIVEMFGEEHDWNAIYTMCRIAWINGTYVEGERIEQEGLYESCTSAC